jgi:large subunit ribosomal protein L21
MYSIVEIAGHQYKVSPGDLIDVELLDAKEDSTMEFDNVLFVRTETPIVGMPMVAGAKVMAKVLRHDKGEKLFFMKKRPGLYKKRYGHRQNYTALLITEITDGQGNSKKMETAAKAPKAKKEKTEVKAKAPKVAKAPAAKKTTKAK